MQDRFKFRAWDKSKNRYLDDTSLEERLYHNATELLGACLALNDGNVNYDYTFEQCTGAKDKNGKLIYEGDIVRYKLFHEDYLVGTYLNKVTFNHGSFTPICNRNVGDVEVIGNIHENPELLEE